MVIFNMKGASLRHMIPKNHKKNSRKRKTLTIEKTARQGGNSKEIQWPITKSFLKKRHSKNVMKRHTIKSYEIRNIADHTYEYLWDTWNRQIPRAEICDHLWKHKVKTEPASKKQCYAHDYNNNFYGEYYSGHDNKETLRHRPNKRI